VDVPISNSLYNLSEIAKFADLVFLMAYDEHWANSAPGPIASRDWFTRGIERAIREIPRDKLVVALGNYGYDWVL
jgi:spore germination protein YaaH